MNKWKQKEKKDSKDFGGRQQRGSGNFWSRVGDVKTDQFLIEAKQTGKGSYSLSLKTWEKISDEALFSFKLPIISLQIQDQELVIVDKKDFLNIINSLKQKELNLH